MSETPKKVAIYSYSNNVENINNELKELRVFCASSGWQICQEYIDHMPDQPAFAQMTAEIEEQKIDILLVLPLDQIADTPASA